MCGLGCVYGISKYEFQFHKDVRRLPDPNDHHPFPESRKHCSQKQGAEGESRVKSHLAGATLHFLPSSNNSFLSPGTEHQLCVPLIK